MDKEQIQNDELEQVSGGVHAIIDVGHHSLQCGTCGQTYKQFDLYPKGFFTGQSKDGCHAVNNFKCPNCGIEWSSRA